MITAVRSSVSALQAASTSLSARADNIANVRTTARVDEVSIDPSSRRPPAGDVFRPTRPTFTAREDGGVEAEIEPVDPSHRVVFDPRDAKADDDGMVAAYRNTADVDRRGSASLDQWHRTEIIARRLHIQQPGGEVD